MQKKNVFPTDKLPSKISPAKRIYYYIVLSGFGVFSAALLYLALEILFDGEWLLAALLGGVSLFIGWIFYQLLMLPRKQSPTTFQKVEETWGYTLHFVNEWTGKIESVAFRYDQITDLLIGLWTNHGFKGRKNDYVGARLLYRYREENGEMKYMETVIISESSLDEWVETIRTHGLPARITNRNIAAVAEGQFDEMLETIEAEAFDGSISVKDFFMQQQDFSLWQPPSIKKGDPLS